MNDSLHLRLLAVPDSDLVPPPVEPRFAALVALGVVDFARSPDGAARFAEMAALGGFDEKEIGRLDRLAHAVLHVLNEMAAAPHDETPVVVPPELDAACKSRRDQLAALLRRHAGDDGRVQRRLAQVADATSVFELALDLRALARLAASIGPTLAPDAAYDPAWVTDARSLASCLEAAVFAHDPPALAQARAALHRAWALFEPAYERIVELGRELFPGPESEGVFPALEAIAALRRARRRSSARLRVAPELASPPISQREPWVPPTEARGAEAGSGGVAPHRDAAPAPSDLPPDSFRRPPVEVELSFASDSNLYLGFTELLAEGGVFVATYALLPIGKRLRLTLSLPNRADPLAVTGVVRWVRPPRVDDELPPGMGVQFVDLSTDAAAALHAFATRRAPLFFDD